MMLNKKARCITLSIIYHHLKKLKDIYIYICIHISIYIWENKQGTTLTAFRGRKPGDIKYINLQVLMKYEIWNILDSHEEENFWSFNEIRQTKITIL